jgi:hypothetical protein
MFNFVLVEIELQSRDDNSHGVTRHQLLAICSVLLSLLLSRARRPGTPCPLQLRTWPKSRQAVSQGRGLLLQAAFDLLDLRFLDFALNYAKDN